MCLRFKFCNYKIKIVLSCLTVVADGAVLQGNFNKQSDSFPTLKGQCHKIFCFRFFQESPSTVPLN